MTVKATIVEKETKYNPSYDVSDYEDVAWNEYLLIQQEYKKKCKDFLIRAGIVDENCELTEEYK